MYQLIDTFNDRIISRHRTIGAAVKADAKFQRRVKRANGNGSYIPTKVLDADGNEVDTIAEQYDALYR